MQVLGKLAYASLMQAFICKFEASLHMQALGKLAFASCVIREFV